MTHYIGDRDERPAIARRLVDLSAEQFARVMFEAKERVQRRKGYHGPDERCANCDHHEVCGNKADFLVPWDSLSEDMRGNLIDLCREILQEYRVVG